MSAFRVTQRSVGLNTLAGLQSNLARLGKIQEQLSSGRQIAKPSDSPTGTVAAMQFRNEIRVNEQWSRNASDGLGVLQVTDQALTTSLSSVLRVRDLTVQGASTATASPAVQEALAAEVDALLQSLIGVANTTHLSRPVFGGVTAGPLAYDPTGTYVGEPQGISRTVAAGDPVRVDITGPEVFGAGAGSLFAVIADIAANMRTNPDALTDDIGRLDAVMEEMQSSLADVGARTHRILQLRQAADDRVTALRGSLAEVESIDLPKTIVDLQMQQVAYEAALGATQRVVTPSLVNFLR